jgi:hypothetical protein
MFRLCWEKYIIDKKFNGYYLWEKIAPFSYAEKMSGVDEDDLMNYFIKDEFSETVEHVMAQAQAKEIGKSMKEKYGSGFKTHVEMTIAKVNDDGYDYDYGTYDDFIAEFTKQELADGWERKSEHPESFFTKEYESKIHASMYCFKNVYMVMKTLPDFARVEEFIANNRYESAPKGKQINKWGE